jgi:superoxide dismutase, Cu-Zn family
MIKPVIVAGALVLTPVVVLSACSSNKSNNNQTTTSSSSSGTATAPQGTERLTTQLKTPQGVAVANATLDFANGFATVTVETVAPGLLSPGFHGLHIHSVGKCEANSVAPTGGPAGDFLSAGGHFQAPGHTGHPASGDLTSLEVRSDGSAKLVTTTDAFTAADLLAGEKTALMIHQDADNFANIPPRYTHDGTPGPDQETLATGDAGKRVACGVIGSSSGTSTATTPATTTTTGATATTTAPTTTTGSPTTTAPTTTAPTSETGTVTTTTPSTATSPATSTVTVTVPTVTFTPPQGG